IEMATVFRREFGNEGRLPENTEGMSGTQRGEAGIECVDENDAAVGHDADIVRIEIAGRVRHARYVVAVGALLRLRAGREHVLKPPELEERRGQNALLVGPYPHGAREVSL